MSRFLRRVLRALVVLLVLAAVAVAWLVYLPVRHAPALAAPDATVVLGQGWGERLDAPLRQAFYWTPQGASLAGVRYDWLVHLEMPWSSRRFADPAHLRGYGFVVDDQPTTANPAQLPVGFARRYDPAIGEAVVDLTCSACHTGQLVVNRQGRRTALRVDGGGAAHAFTTARLGGFVPALTASLAATYFNPLKFRRFGRRVLGEEAYARGKWRLHEDLGRVVRALAHDAWDERQRRLYPVEEGFGRTDALARAANEVFVDVAGPRRGRDGGRTGPLSVPLELVEARQAPSHRGVVAADAARRRAVARRGREPGPPRPLRAAGARRRALPQQRAGRGHRARERRAAAARAAALARGRARARGPLARREGPRALRAALPALPRAVRRGRRGEGVRVAAAAAVGSAVARAHRAARGDRHRSSRRSRARAGDGGPAAQRPHPRGRSCGLPSRDRRVPAPARCARDARRGACRTRAGAACRRDRRGAAGRRRAGARRRCDRRDDP